VANMKLMLKKLIKLQIVSLGCIILGIGFIVLAFIQITSASGNSETITDEMIIKPAVSNHLVIKDSVSSSLKYVQEVKEDIILYPVRPKIGENMGKLKIPKLKQIIPIIEGADEDELKKGVGHFFQSVLPGERNNSVLSGHRDTVFRQLGKLKIGDELITETSAGTFTYIIRKTRIVHKDDKTVIVPTEQAVLTVTTCYPFRYIGDAPDRYIIIADLIEPKAKKS
jgi:sortase A